MKIVRLFLYLPIMAMASAALAQAPAKVGQSPVSEDDSRSWKQAQWDEEAAYIAQAAMPAADARARSVPVMADSAEPRRRQPPQRDDLAAAVRAAQQSENDEQPEYYAGIHLGRHDVDQWKGRVNLGGGVQLDGRVAIDDKLEAGLLVGREYENSRLELEYQQGRYQATGIALGTLTGAVSGKGKYQALTLNAYRVQHLSQRLDAYAGAGIGWGKASLPTLGFAGGCQCFAAADESAGIWQWRLGLEYLFGQNNELFIQYSRVMNIPGPVSAKTAPSVVYEDKDIDTLAIGWRRRFGSDARDGE